jgi:hypothetical protein
MTSMPSSRTHFLELEQRWLRAAASVAPRKVVQKAVASVPLVQETAARAPVRKVEGTAVSVAPKPVQATAVARIEPNADSAVKIRATKFTPDRLEQVRALVALGRSRDEIAALLGVTVGSLQVTCSRLGISLRRPRPIPKAELPRREVPVSGTRSPRPTAVHSVRFQFSDVDGVLQTQQGAEGPQAETIVKGDAGSPNLLLTMEYRGRKRDIPLPLSNETISMLAVEAQVREISLGQLLGAILGAALEKGVPRLLDSDAGDRAA